MHRRWRSLSCRGRRSPRPSSDRADDNAPRASSPRGDHGWLADARGWRRRARAVCASRGCSAGKRLEPSDACGSCFCSTPVQIPKGFRYITDAADFRRNWPNSARAGCVTIHRRLAGRSVRRATSPARCGRCYHLRRVQGPRPSSSGGTAGFRRSCGSSGGTLGPRACRRVHRPIRP